jgi:hypothetical protein
LFGNQPVEVNLIAVDLKYFYATDDIHRPVTVAIQL